MNLGVLKGCGIPHQFGSSLVSIPLVLRRSCSLQSQRFHALCPVNSRKTVKGSDVRRKNEKKTLKREGVFKTASQKQLSKQNVTKRPMGFRTAAARRRKQKHNDKLYTLYTKAFGDAAMISATHLASDRIALSQQPILIISVVSIWWLVAGVLGNYIYQSDIDSPSSIQVYQGIPVLKGLTESLITWVLAMIPIAGIFSLMISQKLIDPSLFVSTENLFLDKSSQGIPGELEVLLDLSVTMCCWRGIHAGLRAQ